jgi:hypothetical protein
MGQVADDHPLYSSYERQHPGVATDRAFTHEGEGAGGKDHEKKENRAGEDDAQKDFVRRDAPEIGEDGMG